MTKAELEDLIKSHNDELEEQYEVLLKEWRELRWENSNKERIKELRAQMDRLDSEKVTLAS